MKLVGYCPGPQYFADFVFGDQNTPCRWDGGMETAYDSFGRVARCNYLEIRGTGWIRQG